MKEPKTITFRRRGGYFIHRDLKLCVRDTLLLSGIAPDRQTVKITFSPYAFKGSKAIDTRWGGIVFNGKHSYLSAWQYYNICALVGRDTDSLTFDKLRLFVKFS